jgi:hypothetical protein
MTASVSWESMWRWLLIAVLLAGMAILLHGCHGDEDNELLVPLRWGRVGALNRAD